MRERLPREMAAVAVILGSLLLLVALASHSPKDPSLLNSSSLRDRPVNLAGPLGATLSAVALDLLGLSALLLPVVGGVVGWRLLRDRAFEHPKAVAVGWCVLFVATPAALGLIGSGVVVRGGSVPIGGVVGRSVGELLQGVAGPVGRLVVLGFLFVIGGLMVSGFSLAAAADSFVRKVRSWWSVRRGEREAKRLEQKRQAQRHGVLKRQAGRIRSGGDGLPGKMTVKELEGRGSFRIVRQRAGGSEGSEPTARKPAPRSEGDRSGGKRTKRSSARQTGVGQEEFEFVEELDEYVPPPIGFLEPKRDEGPKDTQALLEIGQRLTDKCREFNVEGEVVEIRTGPVITTYEFRLSSGVKLSSVQNLAEDLALAVESESVRIERIPGRATVGIEVPNPQRETIRLRSLLETQQFQSAPSVLTIALGVDIHGKPVLADLARMPHLLIGGFTGSGKSVGINAMIMSILYKARPEDVKFILVDPKVVELGVYKDIPHLLTPILSSPKKAANALGWAVAEMEKRYTLLASAGVRNLDQFNRLVGDPVRARRLKADLAATFDDDVPELAAIPYVVIVIDELADLMQTSGRAVEEAITRLAQKARAVGIHLICATQRPSVDVLTGTIKANFPCRIAYKVRTGTDARTILGTMGAERLLGNGDMLMLPAGTSALNRVHGPLVTEVEIARVVRHLKRLGKPEYRRDVLRHEPVGEPGSDAGAGGVDDGPDDPLFERAARVVVTTRKASASYLQRRLRIGYTRAARLVDIMEQEGIVGPLEGSKGREVLVPPDYFGEVDATKLEGDNEEEGDADRDA